MNIKITFYPAQERKYSFSIPVKVTNNSNQRLITCRGEGIGYDVLFEPSVVQLGPVLPLCRVQVINNMVSYIS